MDAIDSAIDSCFKHSTFMSVPAYDRHSGPPPDAGILGVPFDCGTHPFRVGSRQGPAAIRAQSRLLRQFDVDPTGPITGAAAELRLVDFGDVACGSADTTAAYAQIEAAATGILALGATPIAMGGDGAITLPLLRAVGRRHAGLAVLHIDAHTDTYEMPGYNTATTFTRAAEEQLIDVAASVHLGARGTTFMDNVIPFGRSVGYTVIPFAEFTGDERRHVDQLHARFGDRPVYLCFDMDIFDPSCAPGVCTPEWGGLSAREGLGLLRSLAGLNIVACDVNTVSPPHDIGGMTAFLAATVVRECTLLVTGARQRLANPSPAH
jgi:agmatinase